MNRLSSHTGLLLLLLAAIPAEIQAQFNYTINSDLTVTITGYTGPGGAVTVPNTLVGLPVTSIGGSAFASKYFVTSIAIPNSVTNIGGGAFSDCLNLTNVTLPNGLTTIQTRTFSWRKARNPLVHGRNRSGQSEEQLRDSMMTESRIAGAINILALRLVGYSGAIRISAFEDKYRRI